MKLPFVNYRLSSSVCQLLDTQCIHFIWEHVASFAVISFGSFALSAQDPSAGAAELSWRRQGPSRAGTCRCGARRPSSPRIRPPGGEGQNWQIWKIMQIFGGLVLGCIKTKFCKKICVWQHFPSSTRFAYFCTAAISKISQRIGLKNQQFSRKFSKHFANAGKSAKFCRIWKNAAR